MLAARLYSAFNLKVEEVEQPRPPEGWALVKSVAVGVCGTDKAFYSGTYQLFKSPIVLGHEVTGVVEEGPSDLVGELVVSEINFPCWKCSSCRSGLYTHCSSKKTLGIDCDGGLAEYFVAPVEALHKVGGINPLEAVEVEPLAAVLNALTIAPPPPGSKAAVIGSGNVAILTSQVLKLAGVDHVVVVREDSPKAKYFNALGVETVTVEELKARTGGRLGDQGFDVVFECSGNPSAMDLAIAITRPRGVIHLKSTPGLPFTVDLTRAVVKELKIVGSRCGSFKEFKVAIELLEKGVVKPVITSVFDGVDSVEEALRRSFDRSEVKVVVRL